jgi:hypothetical protein
LQTCFIIKTNRMNQSSDFPEDLDVLQSIQVINEMVAVSNRKLQQDAILFIVWGWAQAIGNLLQYIERTVPLVDRVDRIIGYAGILLAIAAFGFTSWYLWNQRKKVQTYVGVSLRYVWIALFLSMVFVNLIQQNVMHSINFELQHPIFMVLVAFATVATGGILRNRMLLAGGILFGLMAYAASLLPLANQLALESLAWALAFVLPGHMIYSGYRW